MTASDPRALSPPPSETRLETALGRLLRHRRLVAAVWAVLALLAAPGIFLLGVDNSPEAFFVRDAEALSRYHAFLHDFGRDRAVRLVLSGPGVWTAAGLAFEASLEEQAAALPGVLATAGIHRHHGWSLDRWPPPNPAAFRRRVTADRLDTGAGWASRDGEVVTVLAVLYHLPADAQRHLLDRLEKLLAAPPPGVEAHLAGLPVLQQALDRSLLEISRRFFPALAALAAALLVAGFRRSRDALVPLLFVTAVQVPVLGLMGYLGQSIDFAVILLVPLLFVISLATAVHVEVHCRRIRRQGFDPPAATLAAYREKAWPVLWTGVTTWLGFGSLTVARVEPVRALGVWSAFALALMTVGAFTLLPALLAGGRGSEGPAAGSFEAPASRGGRLAAAWAVRRRRALFAATLALAVVAAAGLPRLRFGIDLLATFRPDTPARRHIEGLEAHGIGAVAAEVVIGRDADGSGPPPFRGPDDLLPLAELEGRLARTPPVLGAVSAADVLTTVEGILAREPGAAGGGASAWRRMHERPDTARLLTALLTPDGAAARLSLFLPMAGEDELAAFLDRAAAAAREAFPGARVEVTGQYPLVVAAQRTMLRTMALSLSLTTLAIALLLRLLLGSARATTLALIPNLLPVLVALGLMGWLRVTIDGPTVAIASVVLGLAVDDTLHTLARFRRLVDELGPSAAAVESLAVTAPGHLLTTAILVAGFGVCALAKLVPVARFGAFTALALVVALVADLLLVPALLAGLPERAVSHLPGRRRAATPGAEL